ncbi:MAG: endonuclease III [Candidatus Peribacteraceae bacterium]|jgi:endonuclease-3
MRRRDAVPIDHVLRELKRLYKPPKSFLHFTSPLELLIATILSAQCTDERVNIVTKTLFRKYRKSGDYLSVPLTELQRDIHSCGTFRNKAKFIRGTCRIIMETFGGKVPETMEGLLTLPGVGRKTAVIVLHAGFSKEEGIAVDTHVQRLARRLGLSTTHTPEKIEIDLLRQVPRPQWGALNTLMISHGRAVCTARNRKCEECVFRDICPSSWTKERNDLAKGKGR